jgi:Fic family protein
MLFGEAGSKTDHLATALLRPEVAERMNHVYLAKGAHATTAIEGNTLSEDDVLEIVEGGDPVPRSQAYLVQEVRNIVDAYNRIKDELVAGASTEITLEQIKRFNREVLADLELDAGVVPGEFREGSVVVGRYRGAPAAECEYLVERLCEWLNGSDFNAPDEAWAVAYALLKAVMAHLYVAWIHPFGDGNGRTARLIELQILLGAGMPMPATHLLSNHYNHTRAEYYRQLEYASRSGGDVVPFVLYALQGFVDGIRQQIQLVWNQQYDDRWEQFIYQSFGNTHSRAKERQRQLVLELSKQDGDGPVPRRQLTQMTPDLAVAYEGTERTLSRDLNALVAMGLIERVRGGYRPRRSQLLAFKPVRRVDGT